MPRNFKDFNILNVGCGVDPWTNAWNIDILPDKADEVVDITNELKLEWVDHFQEAYFLHTIEHIKACFHEAILCNIWYWLKPGGTLFLEYPEFLKCVDNYKNNYKGIREFWIATIYGRQIDKHDFHVALMDTQRVTPMLKKIGFEILHVGPSVENWNTKIIAKKGPKPLSYEENLAQEIFGNGNTRDSETSR